MTVTKAPPKNPTRFHTWVAAYLLRATVTDDEMLYQARKAGFKISREALRVQLRWMEAQGLLVSVHRVSAKGAIRLGLREPGWGAVNGGAA